MGNVEKNKKMIDFCRHRGRKITDEGCGVPFHKGKISCIKCGKPIRKRIE